MNATKGSADPQPDGEIDQKLVSSHCDQLMEHFDTVRIFVTRYSDGNTRTITNGRGCLYSQYGQVKEWVIQTEEQSKERMRHQDED